MVLTPECWGSSRALAEGYLEDGENVIENLETIKKGETERWLVDYEEKY